MLLWYIRLCKVDRLARCEVGQREAPGLSRFRGDGGPRLRLDLSVVGAMRAKEGASEKGRSGTRQEGWEGLGG